MNFTVRPCLKTRLGLEGAQEGRMSAAHRASGSQEDTMAGAPFCALWETPEMADFLLPLNFYSSLGTCDLPSLL